MSDHGKVDSAFFHRHIEPYTGASREDVRIGPRHGVDFGVLDIGGQAVVLATDPVYVLRELGLERAAWFGVHILLSDAAVSGIPPSHLAVDFNLPPGTPDEEFETIQRVFSEEAQRFGVSIATGHTARYEGCSYPMLGGGTCLAVGDHDAVVRPDGARPGDRVLATKGPAIESVATVGVLCAEALREDLPDSVVEAAQERFADCSPVRDALVAAAAGPVTAMHDATEAGITGGLWEMADSAGVRIDVETERFPVLPGVHEVCEHLGIDPFAASSEGTLLVTVRPEGADDVLAALASEGIPAAEVGTVEAGSGLVMDGEATPHPGADPFWPALSALRGGADA
ncbi:AIR synthase family protein [Natronomonas sp. EA1]|uniref:AIR synthase family protein n=1 Tax=Natronomonas sp. EA1 TaxID=3421655 RepID=UPI003EB7CE67